jgi:hypothetical protein
MPNLAKFFFPSKKFADPVATFLVLFFLKWELFSCLAWRVVSFRIFKRLLRCRTSFERNGPKPCMGVRDKQADGSWSDYQWTTYADINKRTINFASGLRDLGVKAVRLIAIFLVNHRAAKFFIFGLCDLTWIASCRVISWVYIQ